MFEGFRQFAASLETALANAPKFADEDSLARHQRTQIKNLLSLETTFRKTLQKHEWGPGLYREFLEKVVETNILSARPYFRERQTVFTSQISPALKSGRPTALYKFRANWRFISWVMSARDWPSDSPLHGIVKEIANLRKALLTENMPLAVSEARQFAAATPRNHLSFADILQIHAQGLLLAIDKFAPASDKDLTDAQSLDMFRSFRAVAIGIMRRDRVNEYSATLLHHYPRDRQRIYWARKALSRGLSFDEAAEEINKKVKAQDATTPHELASLLAACSMASGDQPIKEDSETTVLESAEATDEYRPDEETESSQLVGRLHEALAETPFDVLETKVLKMKGIRF